jgi:hypothetical protein
LEKEMGEGRKRTLGVIAAIFACRKLAALERKPSPAREMALRDSIDLAVEMMRRIDLRGPHRTVEANQTQGHDYRRNCVHASP